jgi:hypothetical protein
LCWGRSIDTNKLRGATRAADRSCVCRSDDLLGPHARSRLFSHQRDRVTGGRLMRFEFSVPFAILATTGVLPALPLAVPRRSWCVSQIARREALAEPPGRVFSAGRIGFTIAFFQYMDSKLGGRRTLERRQMERSSASVGSGIFRCRSGCRASGRRWLNSGWVPIRSAVATKSAPEGKI